VVDPSILGIAKGVDMVLQRLKRVEQGIRDLKEEIVSLRYYEYYLVTELHRKMDYVMNYNIQLEERKVPQLFYFGKPGQPFQASGHKNTAGDAIPMSPHVV
jgi:hypothetical protein